MKRRARPDDAGSPPSASGAAPPPAAAAGGGPAAPPPPHSGLTLRDRVLLVLEKAEAEAPDGHGLKAEVIISRIPSAHRPTPEQLSAVLTPLVDALRVDMYSNPKQRFSAAEETFFKLVPAERALKLKDLTLDEQTLLRCIEVKGRMGESERTMKQKVNVANKNKLKKMTDKLQRLKLIKKWTVHNQPLWLKEGACLLRGLERARARARRGAVFPPAARPTPSLPPSPPPAPSSSRPGA